MIIQRVFYYKPSIFNSGVAMDTMVNYKICVTESDPLLGVPGGKGGWTYRWMDRPTKALLGQPFRSGKYIIHRVFGAKITIKNIPVLGGHS